MTAKSFILAVQLFARSIFWWPREGQDVLSEKSKTGPKMECRQLAVDHWLYVEGVLLRHGVPADEVSQIGEAYRAGFLRGWSLAWYSLLFGVDCDTAAEWEWWRFSSSRAWVCCTATVALSRVQGLLASEGFRATFCPRRDANGNVGGRVKTGTSCTKCNYASHCPAYDPRIAYGFCQGFEPDGAQSGSMNENAQSDTEKAKTSERSCIRLAPKAQRRARDVRA